MDDSPESAEEVEGMSDHHPFTFYFEELWPLLSERLDSAEILKLGEALPEIEGHLECTKHCWLFDQVIPHLSKWLQGKDLLSLRLTCRPWSYAVDNFLENQPIRRAYDHERSVTGQIWTSDGIPSVLSFNSLLPTICLHDRELVAKFMEDMMGGPTTTPRWRNPFIGRTVHVQTSEGVQSLTGVTRIFQRFGLHVWTLSLSLMDFHYRDYPTLCSLLREWLGHLRNLKYFYLWVPFMEGHDYNSEDTLSGSLLLPSLPFLETLTIAQGSLPPALLSTFFSAYSKQIRRMGLDIRYWRRQFSNMFPNLTELTVVGVTITQDAISDLLFSLQAPRLYHLSFTSTNTMYTVFVLWRVLLTALQRFPQLRNLILPPQTTVFGSDGEFIPDQFIAPSVKYLQLGKQCLLDMADFLRSFPNLEYLHVSKSPQLQARHGPPSQFSANLCNSMAVLRMYESDVWEVLPKLSGITVEVDGNVMVEREERPYRFSRKTYDYRRRMAVAPAQT